MNRPPLGRVVRSLTALTMLLSALPAAAQADEMATNNFYRVYADPYGAFEAKTGTYHSAGPAQPLIYAGFGLVHSYSTDTDYPLAYGTATVTRIDGGLRQTIDPAGPEPLLVEQDSVITGTTEAHSLVRFTLRLRNLGSQPIRVGARSTMDVIVAADDDPRFFPEGGQPLTSPHRYASPAFRTFTLEDHGEPDPSMRTRWTVDAADVDATPPDLLDVAPCCNGSYGPLVPPSSAGGNPDFPDGEVSWIWGSDETSARTISPGGEVEFTVAATLTRGDVVTTALSPPAIEGAARQGATLTGDPGEWSDTALTTFDTQWLRCNSAGAACVPIAGAGGATYAPQTADVGYRLRLRMTPDDGSVAESAATKAVAPPDSLGPAVTAPVSVFVSALGGGGSTLKPNSTPVKTTWSAIDKSGICKFELAVSRSGGAYVAVALAAATTAAVTQDLGAGESHRYRVTATDCAGNRSIARFGVAFTPGLHDAAGAAFTGTWKTQSYVYAFGGSQHYTTVAGSRVSFTATAQRLAFVARVAPASGEARIYLDGALEATVDLGRSAANRMVVYQRSWTTAASHTIVVESVGTAGRPRVDADAFAVFG